MHKKSTYWFLFLTFALLCCQPAQQPADEVRIRVSQDPESLHPVSSTTTFAGQVQNLLFHSLLIIDLADGQLKPQLAEAMPTVERQDSLTRFTYRIRPEARWDNGKPATAADVAFSLKVIKAPLVNNEGWRARYELIRDIQLNSDDSLAFTLVCDGFNSEMAFSTGDFFVLPAYLFDPQGLLHAFSLPQLDQQYDSLANHPNIKTFAEAFNGERFARNPEVLRGSNGYELAEWKTGQWVKLRKKANWWAETLNVSYLTAKPTLLNFQVIPDNATALLALQNGQIDVYADIPATEFGQLRQNPQAKEKFNFFTPTTYAVHQIGVNTRLEKFADRRTRQAIAHLVDVNNIIRVVQQGYAKPTIGLISPGDSVHYNRDVAPFDYNLKRAKQLLIQAGWQQQNGRWVQLVEENTVPLTINLQYRAGNSEHANLAQIFKQSANQMGIPVEIQPVESIAFSENRKTHQFEVFIHFLTGSPTSFDFYPILHSDNAEAYGMNYTGFGTAESDSVILAINQTSDAARKIALLKRLQAIAHEEAALIFLYTPLNRIAVSKRFTNPKISSIRPGYDVSGLEAPPQPSPKGRE